MTMTKLLSATIISSALFAGAALANDPTQDRFEFRYDAEMLQTEEGAATIDRQMVREAKRHCARNGERGVQADAMERECRAAIEDAARQDFAAKQLDASRFASADDRR